MKKTHLYLMLLLAFALLQSCNKDQYVTTTHNLKINEPLVFDFGSFGDEEGASIKKQASHFLVSSFFVLPDGHRIYTYTPSKNFEGDDEVQISTNRGSNGFGPNGNITIHIIKITVTK